MFSSTSLAPNKTDFEPPAAPTDLRVVASTEDTVTISWKASTGTGGAGVLRYITYLDNLDKRATTATTFTFKDLMPGEEYELGVRAFDGQLNNSDKSKLLVTTKK